MSIHEGNTDWSASLIGRRAANNAGRAHMRLAGGAARIPGRRTL